MDLLNQPIIFYLLSGAFTTSALFFIFKFFGVIISEQNSMRYFNKGKEVYTGFVFFVFYVLAYLVVSYYLLSFLNINISESVTLIILIIIFFLLSSSILFNLGKINYNSSDNIKREGLSKKTLSDLDYSYNLTQSLFKKVIAVLPFFSLLNSLILFLIINDYSNKYFLISFLLVVLNYILICSLYALKKRKRFIVNINLKYDKKIEAVELIFMDNNFIMFKDGEIERILRMSKVEEIDVVKENGKEKAISAI
jgi:hypothetical protein